VTTIEFVDSKSREEASAVRGNGSTSIGAVNAADVHTLSSVPATDAVALTEFRLRDA